MPEVEYTTTMALSRETVWEFVKDMNNWAPMLTGYQTHEILDETDSVWTLKGDVGILSRTVKLRAHVTEWIDREKVTFTLTGLNEKVDGGGVLLMDTISEAAPAPAEEPKKKKRRWFGRRFLDWFFRRMFKKKFGPGPERLELAAQNGERARLTFTLRMDAGGPTGPLVNAMLGPALEPACQDLANKIAAHLERAHLAQHAA
ncbi:MAG TPA: SRPBCC family protein [Kofleriaceae bacterium]|nr:SRPBCC family protein [Kofleriaceae bacterium]